MIMHVLLMVGADCDPLEVGQRDSERHISENGNCQAADAAFFINTIGVCPKIILASPFMRTQETGKCLAEKLTVDCNVETVPALMPGAGPDELLRAINQRSEDCSDQNWIAVIIHESDAALIFRSLIGEEYAIPMFPGMVVGLELSCAHAKISGKILFSRYPGDL